MPLPARIMPEIREQIEVIRPVHKEDLAVGYTGVFLPRQLDRGPPQRSTGVYVAVVFSRSNIDFSAGFRRKRRYHLHDSHIQSAIEKAASEAGISSAFHYIHSGTRLQAIPAGQLRHPDDPGSCSATAM